jgi:hypothetical protein
MMSNAKPKLTLTGPVLIDSHMIMPEDLTRMAEIRDLSEQIGNLWNNLSPCAQRFISNTFAVESVTAMSGQNCSDEAVDLICKARPEMVFYRENRSPSTECTEEAREYPMRPKG